MYRSELLLAINIAKTVSNREQSSLLQLVTEALLPLRLGGKKYLLQKRSGAKNSQNDASF